MKDKVDLPFQVPYDSLPATREAHYPLSFGGVERWGKRSKDKRAPNDDRIDDLAFHMAVERAQVEADIRQFWQGMLQILSSRFSIALHLF